MGVNMRAPQKRNRLRSEEGLAIVELVPLIFIFVFILSYTLGSFGLIHTGIKNSIASRTYAFETFRNRTNLVYFRDTFFGDFLHLKNFGNRVHGVTSEAEQLEQFTATERPIRIGISAEVDNRDQTIHNEKIFSGSVATGKRNTQVEVSPAWIMIQYGMCLNNRCGD